jgi:LysM repeat protein
MFDRGHHMFRHIITLLLLCCLSFNLQAQVIELKSNHPDRHVVVKGDTLWGISGRFLKDPWQWPKVWRLNRDQIKNPHLIYPGDVIVLDTSGTSPQLRLVRETVVLQPGAVIEPLEKAAVPAIPLNVIAPFLSQPLIIEKDQLEDSPRIVAGHESRVVLSPGTRIYINEIKEGDGLNWFVYRPEGNMIDPDTKEVLGVEALYLGDARITKYGEPASGEIVRAKEEIFTRDRLVPTGDEVETSFVPHAPEKDIHGRIINIYGGVAEAGPESIVSISRGLADGIEVGHVLAINRYGRIIKDPEPPEEDKAKKKAKLNKVDSASNAEVKGIPSGEANKKLTPSGEELILEPGQIKLPDERIGLLMIFRVFERVSYGLIMQASEPINKLDSVQTP